MPITTCQTHGRSGCPEMCQHLYDDLEKNIFSPFYELPVYTIRMCISCYEQYNVKQIIDAVNIDKKDIDKRKKEEEGVYQIAPDYYFESAILKEENHQLLETIENIYHELNKESGFKCSNCIDKIQIDYFKKNDLKLPFESFENTIINNENKKIGELKKILDDYMGESLHLSKECNRGCEISNGNYRTPLTIKVYGLMLEEEQQSILKLITNFFETIPQKQRKIIFLSSFNWIEGEFNNGIRHSYRGGVKILSEVIIK